MKTRDLKVFDVKLDRPIYSMDGLYFQLSALLKDGKIEGYYIRPVNAPLTKHN